jgi:type IV secretory pathway TrbL component
MEIVSLFLLISIVLLVIHIALVVWAYRDCVSRGKSQEFALITLIGLMFFPVLGLIVYLLIRND